MLGTFHDLSGEEIVPIATEATDRAIESTIGDYRLCSNVAGVHGRCITVDGTMMTEFIQHDWTRLMQDERRQIDAGEPPSCSVGFLAAYQGVRRAIGRLAEDVIGKQVLKLDLLDGDLIEKVYSISEASMAGEFVKPGAGIRCDDFLVVTQTQEKYLCEVKASASGRAYLAKSVPKALEQIRRSIAANPTIHGAALILVNTSVRDKFVVLIVGTQREVLCLPDQHWVNLYLSLAPQRKAG